MSDPSQQPDREEQIRQVLGYLDQHRAQYDLTALRRQLLDAGYTNTVVDEALRRIDGGKTSATDGGRLTGCFLSLANDALLALVVYGAAALGGSWWQVLAAALGLLLLELIVALVIRSRPGGERPGQLLIWVVAWTVVGIVAAGALAALLFGVCLAIFSSQL